ncbi:MAG TPA: serine hydrolase domain-containing protein [Acetobacteraceae bacterium]|nr:serine hydrolase domain-containing protein [Acetobacteraceae bacterium]
MAAQAARTASAGPVPPRGPSADLSPLERDLTIVRPDTGAPVAAQVTLAEALRTLNIPSVGIALIEAGELAWARAHGAGTSTGTLYQAASLSKTVAAVAALCLVQQKRLDLDTDVNARLTSWHIPRGNPDSGGPVTLRGLLSMTGGIGVPGYLGYPPGAPLPNLVQILDGTPPANSPPVRIEYAPGSRYAYSGGGYEIVQALVEDAAGQPFADALQALVLRPAGMTASLFAQPLPTVLASQAAPGHDAAGTALAGGWRVFPELAAAGLWSVPTDLGRLLVQIMRAYGGAAGAVLEPWAARAMLTRQNGGPYGLGAAVAGSGRNLVLMKSGQNVGYQGYMLVFPEAGQGIVVMTGSDNGNMLSAALIRRAAALYGWPPLGPLLP